jgi:hypothetical protein
MNRAALARTMFVLSLSLAAASGWSPAARADETGVEITFTNAGSLSVAWAPGAPAFLVNGSEAGISSALQPVTATAIFVIEIDDTRADGERPGYRVMISASSFTADGSTTAVAPGQFSIVSIEASPGMGAVPSGASQSLAHPVTVLTVPDEAQAVTGTLTLVVAMTIPPGTMPGTYTGQLTLEVGPAANP